MTTNDFSDFGKAEPDPLRQAFDTYKASRGNQFTVEGEPPTVPQEILDQIADIKERDAAKLAKLMRAGTAEDQIERLERKLADLREEAS